MRLDRDWVLLAACFVAGPAIAQQPVKATHSVELPDPEGDVQPGNTPGGSRAPFDVVKLSIKSDGTDLRVGGTVKGELGTFASSVVQIYIDADNNPKTGVETFRVKKPGFEYVADALLCIEYHNGGRACTGSLSGPSIKIKGYYAVATVDRLGSSWNDKQSVRGMFAAPQSPIEGRLVEGKISYADLGVKPGQTIRLAVRETDAGWDETSYFPDVVLTLK